MRAIVETEIDLDEPSADGGLVTWFEVTVMADPDADEPATVARARIARVHVGEAANIREGLHDVLDADSAELEALHHLFFDHDWFSEQFREGAGSDLLYLSEIRVASGWEERNIDLALVRRLCDTIGQGCEVAVVPYATESECACWERMGFSVTTPGKPVGYLHLALGSRRARVVLDEDLTSFRVVPNPPPDQDTH